LHVDYLLEARQLFACPHCNKSGIGLWAKYQARPFNPAVCQYCDKASSISDAVETASTLLYVVAGLWAFTLFFLNVASVRRGEPVTGPTPGALLFSLLIFYVAVEMAKVFWAPMKGFSGAEVEKKKSTSNRIGIAVVFFFLVASLLGKCGY